MFGSKLGASLDERGLKVVLALFFLALAVPTTVLIWQAWSQLKWEAFHQQRLVAEELAAVQLSGRNRAAGPRRLLPGDAEGRFSTPLLPPEGIAPKTYGISDDEHQARLALERQIRQVLSENRLVNSGPAERDLLGDFRTS